MKNYLAVFIGSESSAATREWEKLDEKTRAEREQKGMAAWGAWVAENQSALVQMGSPLGSTLAIGPKGISEIQNELCAWNVVRAESHEAAAKLFLNHPHFTLFPGDRVEIMECLPIPGGI